jgi:hypothetical protein
VEEDLPSHKCRAHIDVKEIDIDYYFETDSEQGKVVIAKGLDGVLYRLMLRDDRIQS